MESNLPPASPIRLVHAIDLITIHLPPLPPAGTPHNWGHPGFGDWTTAVAFHINKRNHE
jgi:hypothetical protein